MIPNRTSESAFESAIELDLLVRGYVPLDKADLDRDRAIFPAEIPDFIHRTQPKEWGKLEALHGAKTGDLVSADLCRWFTKPSTASTSFLKGSKSQRRRNPMLYKLTKAHDQITAIEPMPFSPLPLGKDLENLIATTR